jgi:hypothetical protein
LVHDMVTHINSIVLIIMSQIILEAMSWYAFVILGLYAWNEAGCHTVMLGLYARYASVLVMTIHKVWWGWDRIWILNQ